MINKFQHLTYTKLIALGYMIVILTGTILLLMPFSSKGGQTSGIITALFTATSATCVTGLVVTDTFTQWTLFGQIVILTLIQIGGLGFMTIIAIFALSLKKKIGLQTRSLLRESVNTMYIGGIVRLFKKIIIGTALFEGIGALLLYIRFAPAFGLVKGFYYAVFHSVSAFCNAGFDIMGCKGAYSSLTSFSTDAVVSLTISALIVIGGIGFFVWDDVSKHKLNFKKYELHTKVVLSATAILIVMGTLLMYAFEYDNTMAGMTIPQKIIASLFCAITPRTAGFNVVDVASMSDSGKLLTMIFMFIGGSPGSTAGGVKTTTVAVLFVSLFAGLKNRKGDNIFGRRLEENTLKRATSVVTINATLSFAAMLIITAIQREFTLTGVSFEVLSAIGTVGLTTGITTMLNSASRLIITLLMYCGRVGSMTFALLFTESKTTFPIRKPVGKINIG